MKPLPILALAVLALLVALIYRGTTPDLSQTDQSRADEANELSDEAQALDTTQSNRDHRSEANESEGLDEEPAIAWVLPADIRPLLRAIAIGEQAIVKAGSGTTPDLGPALTSKKGPSHDPQLVAQLERAVEVFLDFPDSTALVLGLCSPTLEGELQLDELESYGAVRALYWMVVVRTGRGEGRDQVLAVLSGLPDLHPAIQKQLVATLTAAAADGKLVLDESYLQDILYLRSLFPEAKSLYSALFQAIGDSMTPEGRAAFFSVFGEETSDPVLVGLTVKNLLLGDDPDFGLFLASQRVDDPGISVAVKKAIASAVANNADVYSAAEFLSSRADGIGDAGGLWLALGIREGAVEALEGNYAELAEAHAHPEARRALVSGMRMAAYRDLMAIAVTDLDGAVAAQALQTVSMAREPWTESEFDQILSVLEDPWALPSGGSGDQGRAAIMRLSTASNAALKAKKVGNTRALERAIAVMKMTAQDSTQSDYLRSAAIGKLKPYLTPQEIEDL